MLASVTDADATTPADLALELCRLGAEADSLLAWREAALASLGRALSFDRALFHELSPRVPLAQAASLDLNLERLAADRSRWDDFAVEFGVLQQRALAQGGVATAREAFGARGPRRDRWEREVARPLGIRSLLAAHLVLAGRIISVVLLARRGDPEFTAREAERLRRLVPALVLADGYQRVRAGAVLPGQAVGVRCRDERLTPRQREIVEFVALGRSNAEIGRALGVSEHTVRNSLVTIRRRLGAANRAELVRVAVLYPGSAAEPES